MLHHEKKAEEIKIISTLIFESVAILTVHEVIIHLIIAFALFAGETYRNLKD